jgi:hypothetical protein
VADVGDIHQVDYFEAGCFQETSKQIREKKGTKIPDVSKIVDRWPTRIHANGLFIERLKRLGLPCKTVVKLNHAFLKSINAIENQQKPGITHVIGQNAPTGGARRSTRVAA